MPRGVKRLREHDIPAQLAGEGIGLRMRMPHAAALPAEPSLPSGFQIVPFGEGGTSSRCWTRICKDAGVFADEDDPEAALMKQFDEEFGIWTDSELPKRMLFMVDGSGEAVATATAWFELPVESSPSVSRGRVAWVLVSPSAQGRGLAKLLVLRAVTKLREMNGSTDSVYVTTQTASARAIAMYVELGFTPEPCDQMLRCFTHAEQRAWQMLANKLQSTLGFTWTPGCSPARRKLIVYLASPLGFSLSMKEYVLPKLVEALEKLGVEVYEPFQRNVQAGLIKKEDAAWAWNVAEADARAVQTSDAIFAVVNGVPPDEGVCVELGIAIACNKPIFLFRDDFRKAADSETFPCNLMLMAGLPKDEAARARYMYTSIEQISDASMALADWVTRKSA